jgi:hypothetical protein
MMLEDDDPVLASFREHLRVLKQTSIVEFEELMASAGSPSERQFLANCIEEMRTEWWPELDVA